MKKIFSCVICLLICRQVIYSQNTIGLQNDLKNVTSTGALAGGTVISSFSSGAVKGNRYLFDSWTPGSVTSINNEVYAANYKFNFDKINQDIYAEYNNNNVSVVLDKPKVKRFNIGSLLFVNSSMLHSPTPGAFYQALVEDSNKISLYKLTTTKFVKANPNDIMNARTGNLTSEYVDDNKYFIAIKNGDLKKITLNENNIRKVLKDKGDKVDGYFNQNSSKEINEKFLVELIQFVNQ
jgi:hypothetical protein